MRKLNILDRLSTQGIPHLKRLLAGKSMRTVGLVTMLGLLIVGACSPSPEAPAQGPTSSVPAATNLSASSAAEPSAVPAAAPPAVADAQAIELDIRNADGVQMSGDAARGQTVFKKCTQCHSTVKGKNGTGPSLQGIVGQPAGSAPNFRYSDANRTSGITWNEEQLFLYLENPKKMIPKTIMAFAGLPKAQDRADLIAYLKLIAQK